MDEACERLKRASRPSGIDARNVVTPSHRDSNSQYTSFRFTVHLLAAGIDASFGSVGDALMESQIGLYKTAPISPDAPWRSLADGELATAAAVTGSTNGAPLVTGAEGD
ncbi:hypothetical protein [Nonomuraea wenchangensis]|uniref:hypothetical protein n=1 Tax=Nonomuraea wenchangensis TaxID=568860 RepID=UPI001160C5F7